MTGSARCGVPLLATRLLAPSWVRLSLTHQEERPCTNASDRSSPPGQQPSTRRGHGGRGRPLRGIFTTNADGTWVNGNVYDDGRPSTSTAALARTSAARPPVSPTASITSRSHRSAGKELLSGYGPDNGIIEVRGGMIHTYSGPHDTGVGRCDTPTTPNPTVKLWPFGTTPNPGGEYKVWMTPVGTYASAAHWLAADRSVSSRAAARPTTSRCRHRKAYPTDRSRGPVWCPNRSGPGEGGGATRPSPPRVPIADSKLGPNGT